MGMTPEEKFLFDLQGYIVVKNVLSAEELTTLNTLFEQRLPEDVAGKFHSRISNWGKPFQDLMDHPKILPYLLDLIDPHFRLDHDYCIYLDKGAGALHLHGGEGHEGDHWYKYRDGVMKNGLTVVSYALADNPAGAGGFICIPGTHKSNFIENIPREVALLQQPADYVVQPAAQAGDAIIFTEALVHGTHPWTANHARRALLYKFSPGHSAWRQDYYSPNDYEDLTDQQKRILEPPSVGNRPYVVQ